MQPLRREIITPVVRPAITSRRDLTAKVVSLVGSDCIIGSCLQSLPPHHIIAHSSSSFDINKPSKAVQIIRRGNPDCYVIGVSPLDGSEQLFEIAKIVIEAAKLNGAQIVAFTDYRVYGESELQKTENSPIEQTVANPLVLYERLLNKYKNPLIFRIGKLFENKGDFVSRFWRTLCDREPLEITDIEYSLTSVSLLRQSVALAIAWRYIETYNLCESGIVDDVELVSVLIERMKSLGYEKYPTNKLKVIKQEEVNHCLDNSLWQAFSMTEVADWTTMLHAYLLKINSNEIKH